MNSKQGPMFCLPSLQLWHRATRFLQCLPEKAVRIEVLKFLRVIFCIVEDEDQVS